MKQLERYKIDGRATRINDTDWPNWWVLQQNFAYPPFNEFFDTDKLESYYQAFSDGGVYQLEINVSDDIWLPLGFVSWHPRRDGAHPVVFAKEDKVAYISDSLTYLAYQGKGVQNHLFSYAFDEMRARGFNKVYLRTSPESNMNYVARKLGFSLVEDVFQDVTSMRVGGHEDVDKRIFFVRDL